MAAININIISIRSIIIISSSSTVIITNRKGTIIMVMQVEAKVAGLMIISTITSRPSKITLQNSNNPNKSNIRKVVVKGVALLERCRSYTSVNPSPPSRKSTKSTCAASAGNPATSTTWAGTRSRTFGAASRRRSARDHLRWPTPPNPRRHRRRHCEPSAQLLRVEAARPSRDRVRPHRSGTHGIARQRLSPRTSSRSRRRKFLQVISRSLPPKPQKVKPVPEPKPCTIPA